MFTRAIFGVKQALLHKSELSALPYKKNLLSIDWNALRESGVRVVVLDFDGVLAEDDALSIRKELFPLFDDLKKGFEGRIYILSNKPKAERQAFFAQYFPYVRFMISKKKPYPDGLLEIIQEEQVSAEQVVLIDDRLLTGGLASVLAKTGCIIIEKPYMALNKNWAYELLFIILRALERFFFR